MAYRHYGHGAFLIDIYLNTLIRLQASTLLGIEVTYSLDPIRWLVIRTEIYCPISLASRVSGNVRHPPWNYVERLRVNPKPLNPKPSTLNPKT